MRKTVLAVAWWFTYSLTSAQSVDMKIAGPFDNEVTCNRMRDDLIGKLGILMNAYGPIGFNFSVYQCQPDRVDKMPR